MQTSNGKNTFVHAASNANPSCLKCKGTGTYMYDHNHGTICDLCCQHDLGRWLLKENYGVNNDRWCCLAGCGKTWATKYDE